MPLPVDVTFRNLKAIDRVEDDVRKRAGRLMAYCPDLLACRVLIEIPHRHHLHGNRFQVRVDLTVRGDEIVITHAPRRRAEERRREEPNLTKSREIDATRRDLRLLVRETFDIARRQLQDYARRRRGAIKLHPRPGPLARRAAERAGATR
jgi:hypothetical protein